MPRGSAKAAAAPADPVDALVGQIRHEHGDGAIMTLSGPVALAAVEVISTGSLSLDIALGVGGLPRGRVVEIFGPEGSGKSTLGMHLVASAQRGGGVAAYIDAEHAVDPDYARAIGVNTDTVLFSQPDSAEQALSIADMMARSAAVDVIIVDSVAALVPMAELEGDMGASHPGLQARLMAQALRKITHTLAGSRTLCLFINQLREKIGVTWGNPETTPGGKALKFFASVRLDIRRIEALKDGATHIGSRTRVKVVKNKLSPPYRTAEFDLLYGRGVYRMGELVDLGVNCGVLVKSGAWYAVKDGQALGQGRANAASYLQQTPEAAEWVEAAIRQHALGIPANT